MWCLLEILKNKTYKVSECLFLGVAFLPHDLPMYSLTFDTGQPRVVSFKEEIIKCQFEFLLICSFL